MGMNETKKPFDRTLGKKQNHAHIQINIAVSEE